MIKILNPEEIYKKSFDIIRSQLNLDNSLKSDITVRVIHATADYDIGRSLMFGNNPDRAVSNLKNNIAIITDINMVKSGITGYKNVKCFINDRDVIEKSKSSKISRSYLAIKKAVKLYNDAIFVIGDAPTALLSLIEEIENNNCRPSLVIGVPVGFVNAIESKYKLLKINYPFITNMTRKGGTPTAVAIINELIKNVY